MGSSYGVGILDYLPEEIESFEEKLEFLQKIAALGLTPQFKEIIDDRVVEINYQNGVVTYTWLAEEAATQIVAATKCTSGSSSNRSIPDCLDVQLYIPGCRKKRGAIELPDSSIEDWEFMPMSKAINELKKWVKYIKDGEIDGDLSLTEHLLEVMQLCKKHQLLFTIDY